jgi:hypothetical protein
VWARAALAVAVSAFVIDKRVLSTRYHECMSINCMARSLL